MGNKLVRVFFDALGNAFGYGWILVAVAFVRELLFRKLMGYDIPGFSYLYQMGYNNNLIFYHQWH